jgi:hypothetical protein
VGDPLALRFEIEDEWSPYQIFVRELVAMDGKDTSEILLIDSIGQTMKTTIRKEDDPSWLSIESDPTSCTSSSQ